MAFDAMRALLEALEEGEVEIMDLSEEKEYKRQTRRRRNRSVKGKTSFKKSVENFCESQGCIPNGNPCQCAHLLKFLEERNES